MAPASIASVLTVTVTVTSAADPTKSASATVTLTPATVAAPLTGDGLADPLHGFAASFAESAVHGNGNRRRQHRGLVVGESGDGNNLGQWPVLRPSYARQSAKPSP